MTATDAQANSTTRSLRRFIDKRRTLRRSMGFVFVAWIFGAVWQFGTGGVQFTRFAETLHASKFQFGLLSALPFLSSLLSMAGGFFIERTGERKNFFLITLYAQRLLWFPIALVPVWIVTHRGLAAAPQAVTLFIVLYALMCAAGSAGAPAWLSWMADVVPERIRGSFFSRRRQWGLILALFACIYAAELLKAREHQSDPMGTLRICALIFMVSAVFGCADIAMHHFVPAVPRKPQSGASVFKGFLQPLRNRQFLIFCEFVGLMVFSIAFVGQFISLYVMKVAGVNDLGNQLMLMVAPMAAQFFALPLWGKAADRFGKKPLMVISSLGIVPFAFAWSLVGPHTIWLGYVVAVFGAVLWNGAEVANVNLCLEFSGSNPEDSSQGGASYSAVNGVVTNIAGFIGGLAGGLLAERMQDWIWAPAWGFKAFTFFDVLFAICGLLRLLAFVIFVPLLHEPKARPAAEALRFMSVSICNGALNTVLWPLRFFRSGQDRIDSRG